MGWIFQNTVFLSMLLPSSQIVTTVFLQVFLKSPEDSFPILPRKYHSLKFDNLQDKVLFVASFDFVG